ncbi:MAG: hypothetical protein GEU90_16600 [Gemmatimonas sp.]|nr:hypothetical protein [Gemmatimonas sp.]
MDLHTIYCSGCDRNVAIIPRLADWRAALSTGEIACLEQGVRCSGALCPIYADLPLPEEREEASRAGGEPPAT